MRNLRISSWVIGLALALPGVVHAQRTVQADTIYRREVFRYASSGRPDPFRSLLTVEELGYRVEDLQLSGIIYSTDPGRSAAILSEAGSNKRFRLRVGDRLGGITIAAITPRQVDVVVNEFGIVRRQTMTVKRPVIAVDSSRSGFPRAPLPTGRPAQQSLPSSQVQQPQPGQPQSGQPQQQMRAPETDTRSSR